MNGCRICLGNPKTLYSVFEDAETENGLKTYAEIMAAIADVKISQDDGSFAPDKICRGCRKKLLEAYGFKVLIERSNATFELNAKRLNFNNINDIKIEMDLLKVENDENKTDSRTMPGFDKSDNILYNDTTIKKVNIDKKHINIEDFLENIKKEANDFETEESHFVDDFADNPGDSNEEDVPLLKRIGKMKSRNKRNKKKHKEGSDDEYSPGPLDEGDEEYVPVPKKTNIKLNNTGKRVGRPRKLAEGEKERKFVNVLIKPKILREIVTLPSKRRKKPKPESKQKKFQLCPHCGKQMKSLKSHLLLHIGERKYRCDQCTKSYFNEKDLNTHMIKHGSKNYKCDQCIADFHTPESLRSHKLSHSQEKKFVCNICNKAFRRVRVMQIHRKQHNIANKNFKCHLCNMSFFSKSHLNHHMRIHTGERPFNCKKYFLQRHQMIHNLASKTIKCEFCNMTFYTNANLRHHLRIHTGERPFNCERHIMRRHYNAHSLANKNIKCDQCNMTFFTKSTLNHHIRIHTGERPFNCELCSQPYSYKHDFNRHCLKKHGIFLKRRKVYIMNEEVLAREREMMKEVVRRAQGNLKEGESINPFEAEGPGSHLAFIQIMKALQNNQIQIPADVSY